MRAIIVGALIFFGLVLAARADVGTDYCGQSLTDSKQVRIIGKSAWNEGACTANCFRFELTCQNGRRLSLTSQYSPITPEFFIVAAKLYPFLQLGIFAMIALFVLLARMGKSSELAFNIAKGYLLIAGIALFFSDGPAKYEPLTIYSDFGGILIGFWIVATPVFVIGNLSAMMKGWNYVFVRHAVASIVDPALRSDRKIDGKAVAKTLAHGATDAEAHPMYYYENQTEKARGVAGKLNRNAELAAAKLKRERARAELEDAERDLEESQRRGRS